jgi:hypothetical protein
MMVVLSAKVSMIMLLCVPALIPFFVLCLVRFSIFIEI